MISFAFTEEQEAYRVELARFARTRLQPEQSRKTSDPRDRQQDAGSRAGNGRQKSEWNQETHR